MFAAAAAPPTLDASLGRAPAATSSSVVHSPCGSIRILNVSPSSSTFAGAVAEIVVSRVNVSRS